MIDELYCIYHDAETGNGHFLRGKLLSNAREGQYILKSIKEKYIDPIRKLLQHFAAVQSALLLNLRKSHIVFLSFCITSKKKEFSDSASHD